MRRVGDWVFGWTREWLERRPYWRMQWWIGGNSYSLSWLQILLAHHGAISQRQLICRAARRLHGLREKRQQREGHGSHVSREIVTTGGKGKEHFLHMLQLLLCPAKIQPFCALTVLWLHKLSGITTRTKTSAVLYAERRKGQVTCSSNHLQ